MSYYEQKDQWHSLLILGGVALTLRDGHLYWVVGAGVLAFGLMFYGESQRKEPGTRYLNSANMMTGGRLLVLLVSTLLYDMLGPILYGVIASAVAISDAVDGYLARKYNTTSRFGAAFDMETDALFVSILSLIAYQVYDASWLVLLAGQMRYLFVWILKWTRLDRTSPPRLRGSQAVAVIFFVVLLTPFFFAFDFVQILLVIGSLLICISFLAELIFRWSASKKGPHIG